MCEWERSARRLFIAHTEWVRYERRHPSTSTRQSRPATMMISLLSYFFMNRFAWVAWPVLLTGCVIEQGGEPPARTYPVAVVSAPSAPLPPQTVVAVQQSPLPDDVVIGVYEDQLGRRPSARELWEWRERTAHQPSTAMDIRVELRRSEEYRRLDPTAVVWRACRDLLGRDPDRDAVRYYRRRLIDDDWTVGQVRRSIARHERRIGTDDDHGTRRPGERRASVDAHDRRGDFERFDRDPYSPESIITRAYDDLLEREPDSAGFDRYLRMLRQGESEKSVRGRIKQSVEYRVTLPDSKTTRAYREVLGRDPDASGMETYRRKLVDQGWTEEDVKNSLRQSAEYKSRRK